MRALTLTEALAYAGEHQPSLQAALARLRAARQLTGVPRGFWYPRLGMTAQALVGTANNSTASYFGSAFVDLPRIGGTRTGSDDWEGYPSTLVAGGLRQEVYDFGRIGALSEVVDRQLQAESGRADLVRLDLVFAVKTAFYAVQAGHELLAASKSALDRARVVRDMADAGVRAGLRSPIEMTRADAEYARFEVGLVQAQASLAVSQSDLAAVIGAPDPALDASGELALPVEAPPYAEALSRAIERDPGLAVGRALVFEQRAQTVAISAELRPEILASATLSARDGGAPPSVGSQVNGWVPGTPNWDVGLVFSWPLFDQTVRARAQTSARLEDARRSELQDLEQRLRAGVEQAYVGLQSAQQALPALQKAVAASRANYEQADARFKAGLGTSVELADAADLLASSEVNLALGRFTYARERARLARVTAEEP